MDTPAESTSWFDELWPRLIAYSGIGYVVTAYAVSRWLTRCSPADLTPPALCQRVDSLSCQTADGITLHGWCVEPMSPRASVVLFHGMRLNRSALLDRVEFLCDAGYRCVLFDHRAHGQSGGHLTSFGYHERHDVAAVAELVARYWPNQPRAALGNSMGAAALCFAGNVAHLFAAVVLESMYHDLDSAFRHRVGRGMPGWFAHFRRGIRCFTEYRLGMSIHEVSPAEHVVNLAPQPVLLLTGSNDPHAPPHEVRAIADRIPHCSEFHVIDGAGHHGLCEHGGDPYRDLILGFLAKHLFARRQSRAA
ncbi:MAG: alpha/beta hydrolase [Planctomycetes bacterium]|nr:alpha/beta hydrolase [Planctomycetota bacterium]